MKSCLVCAGLIVCALVGCGRNTADPDSTTGVPAEDVAMPQSEVDLAEATLSSEGLPTEVAIGGCHRRAIDRNGRRIVCRAGFVSNRSRSEICSFERVYYNRPHQAGWYEGDRQLGHL